MSGIPGFWTKAKIKQAKDILGKHTSLPVAVNAMTQAFKVRVTRHALDSAFDRVGEVTPFNLLKKEVPEIHPVERQEKLDQAASDKKKIKDLVQELRDARARQAFIDELKQTKPTPKIIQRERTSGLREMTAVALASDWHVEEIVDPESVAYCNEYNIHIAEQRIVRFFQSIIWNFEHNRASGRLQLRDLVLWLGGDLITGYIHQEYVESNQMSPTETVCWLMPKVRDGILSLLKHLNLEHIEIPCSYGNHGRTTDKTRILTGYANSYEWLMYKMLSDEMKKEERVHFEITNSPHQYIEVYGKTQHFHHGDDVRYQGGVGGLAIPLLKALPAWDMVRYAETHNIGHHHTFRDFGRAVVNGSLIGYGTYSQHIKAPFEVPQQAFYWLDSHRGKCMTTPLWVSDDVDEETVITPKGAKKK